MIIMIILMESVNIVDGVYNEIYINFPFPALKLKLEQTLISG